MAVGWRGNLPSSPALPPPEAGAGRTRGELQAGFRPSPDARSQTAAAGQAGLRGAPRPGRLPGKAPAPHPARPPPTAPGEDRGIPTPRSGTEASGAAAGAAAPRHRRPPQHRVAGPASGRRPRSLPGAGLRPGRPHGGGGGAGLGPGSPEGGGRRVSPRRPTWLRPGAERSGAEREAGGAADPRGRGQPLPATAALASCISAPLPRSAAPRPTAPAHTPSPRMRGAPRRPPGAVVSGVCACAVRRRRRRP